MVAPMRWEPAAWSGPHHAAYAPVVAALATVEAWPSVAELDELLAPWLRAAPRPMRLVEQTGATGVYELCVVDQAEIPTRTANAHDLWNAIVWATFPRSKWALAERLGALQRARVAAGPLPGTRGPRHDRLALVDEGGLAVVGDRAVIVGHAILEHAARGAAGAVRAARIPVPAVVWTAAAVDAALADAIAVDALGQGPGVPIELAALAPWD